MKKVFGFLGKTLVGNTGLVSLIKEKTGKISFKRSASIIIITMVVIPDFDKNGLTALNVALTVGCLIAVALPKVFSKDSE